MSDQEKAALLASVQAAREACILIKQDPAMHGNAKGLADVVLYHLGWPDRMPDGRIGLIWCQCYGTPEPKCPWVHPDDEHADTHGLDALIARPRPDGPADLLVPDLPGGTAL